MTGALAVLATIEDANARYGPILLPALVAVGFLLWWAHRPVKVRPPREAGPGIFSGLGRLLADNLAARAATRAGPGTRRPPARGTWRLQAPGRALPGGRRFAAMPAPARPLSDRYRAYIAGQVPGDSGDWGGWTWPEKRRAIMAWYRQRFGPNCLLGVVCGGTARATQLDHRGRSAGLASDYAELFRETPASVAPVCRDCHDRRTALARQGIDAWTWRVARR
jgi:hypothetical protein